MNDLNRPHKFRDPVHGFVYLSDHEKELLDTVPFQRLRRIKQLSLTSYVYHGAEHTRFGHSIGAAHVCSRAFQSAVSKNRYEFSPDKEENRKIIIWLEQILRLIALTHDLGHPPFSHAGEGLFPLKSENEGKKKSYKHEDLTEAIILSTEIADIIVNIGNVFKESYGLQYDITPDMICDIYKGTLPGKKSVFIFLRTFMDSEVDCDKMDYLLRDSLFCGVSYGKFDLERLIACLTIFTKKGSDNPFLGIESGGVHVFEEFVLARYFMFVQVYFHRTRRYFDLLLSRALREVLPNGTFPINVSEYMKWDDAMVMQLLKNSAENNENARGIIERRPWTCVYSTKVHPTGDGLRLFNSATRTIRDKFDRDLFNKHFVIDKSADKLPHKIIPRKYSLDDEDTIAIVNDESLKISTISEESQIINNLTEKINVQRIYADDAHADKAKEAVRFLLSDSTEDDENYE